MADAETLAVYDSRAADYADLPMTETQVRALDRFLDGLAPPARILDLGCGPGIHAARMAAAGHVVTGIDASPGFVAAARARGVDARLGTFDDLSESAAYDAAWASFSLLHAPRADMPRHLAALRRALKPGGRLFLGLKTGTGEGRDALGRFYTFYAEDELRALLDAAGFRIDRTETGAEAGLAGSVDPFILVEARADG
ncbi:methyltransferase domain-containing protein [Rhodobacterales bacterium HKCCE2091]|nr:methyltransferase domain-containing protein [Rhodobacterales bacterium HKCCE2091]